MLNISNNMIGPKLKPKNNNTGFKCVHVQKKNNDKLKIA